MAPIEEKKALQKKSTMLMLMAIGIVIVGTVISASLDSGVGAALLLASRFGALGLWIPGCMAYAESKAYSKWVGLLGLLTIIGLIILVVLPDKWKNQDQAASPTNYPRPPAS